MKTLEVLKHNYTIFGSEETIEKEYIPALHYAQESGIDLDYYPHYNYDVARVTIRCSKKTMNYIRFQLDLDELKDCFL